MDSIQKPDANNKAMEIQTMAKKRLNTADIKAKRSGGAIRAMTTGRSAKITKAMPPSQTMPALKCKNLIHSYIGLNSRWSDGVIKKLKAW
ncbi:hypothetical protein [Limnohabitans sp.]|uniref:hypothetical protein n=1 Tax=Limnohabitans sp. TaxID=1907725 RepID=UPI003341114A